MPCHLKIMENNLLVRSTDRHTNTGTNKYLLYMFKKKKRKPQLYKTSQLLQVFILHIKITGLEQHAANYCMVIFLFPKKPSMMHLDKCILLA